MHDQECPLQSIGNASTKKAPCPAMYGLKNLGRATKAVGGLRQIFVHASAHLLCG